MADIVTGSANFSTLTASRRARKPLVGLAILLHLPSAEMSVLDRAGAVVDVPWWAWAGACLLLAGGESDLPPLAGPAGQACPLVRAGTAGTYVRGGPLGFQ